MRLTIEGQTIRYDQPVQLTDVLRDLKLDNKLAATVNGRLRELTYIETKDADIEFLGYEHSDAIRVYESTLRYVVAMAIYRLFPHVKVKFNYSISRSILAILEHHQGPINPSLVETIKAEVISIIKKDLPIDRKRVSVGEAVKVYSERQMNDKIAILEYREEDYVNTYECDGYINYMFGYMLPSTGYLKTFHMFSYSPGFIIQYPRAEAGGIIPEFVDEPIFGQALKEVAKWGKIIQGNTIPKINEYAKDERSSVDFVNMCETKHFHQLNELGTIIQSNIESIRLIGIAGPSSSGKTTFSNRLRVELMSRGLRPLMISIDDYYLGKEHAPKNEDGSPDLEHIDALDVALFNHDMLALIQGQTVTLPKFNFKSGQREQGKTVSINEDTPIIIEGIHALNEKLTKSIPKHQKFKIYIAPQTQLHIDDHNPISITELRLLRRIVRDQKYRGTSALDTMNMWSSVRRGEFRWIYPFQKEANYTFNSELTYELAVLKTHATAQLLAIPKDSKHYITANRLLKFLKYFKTIHDDLVPCNSLLREFIGGSSFHD
ncbi:MAG: nucleoside kinase [Acholeplasma sp.]|jgi:uridine kinase|nr:MAG: nucleoside kinase [Acholeplasma sp.]